MPNPIEVTVSADFDGYRLDVFLTKYEGLNLTRNTAQRLLEEGQITRKGVVLGKSYRVTFGDIFLVNLPAPVPSEIKAEEIILDIVYEDNDIIVINKPRGMVVHPAAGHFDGTLVNALLHHCGDCLSGIGGVERPGIVHRLDKDTSGLMVVAKNDTAHQSLSRQLADRSMVRIYHALCLGVMKREPFTINQPIGRHPVNRQKMAVRPGARQGVTFVRVLQHLPEHKPKFTLVEARLETGRTHQIRVHMAFIGFPVLGDRLYGPEINNIEGQMLHATRLELVHPVLNEKMVFEREKIFLV